MTSAPDPVPADAEEPEEENSCPAAACRDFVCALCEGVDVALRRRGPDLVIGFAAKTRPDPLARLAAARGWSYLGLVAERPAQLRTEPVTGFFDALADGTLLDAFGSVTFAGAGAWADAALGYALCAPASRVLAIGLPASPTPAGRYAVTPDLLAAATAVYLVHDPRDVCEAATARRLAGGPVLALPCRIGEGSRLDALARIGALDAVVAAAVAGQLDPPAFHRLLRARRRHAPALRSLAKPTSGAGLHRRAARAMRHIGARLGPATS